MVATNDSSPFVRIAAVEALEGFGQVIGKDAQSPNIIAVLARLATDPFMYNTSVNALESIIAWELPAHECDDLFQEVTKSRRRTWRKL